MDEADHQLLRTIMKIEIPDLLYKKIRKLELYEGLSKEEAKEQLEEEIVDFLEDYLSEALSSRDSAPEEDEA